MSILPSQSQIEGSKSSLSNSQNPNFNHGNLLPLSPSSKSIQIPGPLDATIQDAGGPSKEVSELGTPNGKNHFPHQSRVSQSWNHSGVSGVGSTRSRGKMLGPTVSLGSQQSTVSMSSQGSTTHSAGKRAQMINGNHLLNFQYDPINRPQYRPTPPPPRRQRKIKPYNKDLFLQANYKFVVLDTGNYIPETMDPDKMLQWEDIICVRYSTPFPVQCPICLEYPLCPQMTSCGHIFCFPCILRYLLMGQDNHKGDCFEKCPLCFVMISPKDLYTIDIKNVTQYHVGDTIEFMLLTREKDSFALSQKTKQDKSALSCSDGEGDDPFSKFTFTSDVDLSVRKAISDLDGWLAKADAGLVDDLEKLPYVCAAMEQLEQRKKYWNEHRACDGSKSGNYTDCHNESHGPLSIEKNSDQDACGFGYMSTSIDISEQSKLLGDLTLDKSSGGTGLGQSAVIGELSEGQDTNVSSSYDENKILQIHFTGSRDVKDKDSYNFYQATDGQHLILHPLNMKCLLHHYGSYDMLPDRISGRILQLETVTQSEAIRRRYRYLSHFSLTTTFQLCEIDLGEMLPADALFPFMDEIKKRERQRKQLAKLERKEKMKAEAALVHSVPVLPRFGQSSHDDYPTFSMDDFEALGSAPVASSSPPNVVERRLFSSVTRLGFAAGHDSPSLKTEETSAVRKNEGSNGSSGVTVGSRNLAIPSFANVISREKNLENLDSGKMNEVGKKGKKPSRVLLSTSGSRRY
ncbi:RING finger protein 10 isoform X3 [Mangifera indica]|uniref:RING finger protein 10 isoform X3 n=1 Tax=Mangifera indica TaxID=29780 RepID=UPI001CFBA92F|nr:RING finger protein 10 isoform X3 [Mangifera indica]